MPSAGVERLAAAAGSPSSIERGKWLAVGMVAVGVVGALGVAARPILRHAFKDNARRQAVAAVAARETLAAESRGSARVQALVARIEELEARQRARALGGQ